MRRQCADRTCGLALVQHADAFSKFTSVAIVISVSIVLESVLVTLLLTNDRSGSALTKTLNVTWPAVGFVNVIA